ncbi:MAG: hypothetical protein LBO74_06650 [Candidatus Symbiothrix sp.]|jgi:hypothetical protein|nr:hypothetical protein [Candidatus Symbiothrix sp.]
MKKNLFLLLMLIGLSMASVKAQVLIGGTDTQTPHEGAILDLSKTTGKGLLLPKVNLIDETTLAVAADTEKGTAIGMMVYNTNTTLGEGIYVFDGQEWKPIESGLSASQKVTGFTLNPSESATVSIWNGGSQLFTVMDFIPEDATYPGVSWKITEGDDVIQLLNPLSDGVTVKGLQPGTATIEVTSMDKKTTKEISIEVKEVTVTVFSLDKTDLTVITGGNQGIITATAFKDAQGNATAAVDVVWTIVGAVPSDTQIAFTGTTATIISGTAQGSFVVEASIATLPVKKCSVLITNCTYMLGRDGRCYTVSTGTHSATTAGSCPSGFTRCGGSEYHNNVTPSQANAAGASSALWVSNAPGTSNIYQTYPIRYSGSGGDLRFWLTRENETAAAHICVR